MDQEFECKEPGCGKRVEYESQPVEFLETVELPTTIGGGRIPNLREWSYLPV